jgi:hypothetical protein
LAWTPLFFGIQKVKLAAFDCGLLTLNVAAMTATWWKVELRNLPDYLNLLAQFFQPSSVV